MPNKISITVDQAVQIFYERREELRPFKERVHEKISDSEERYMIEFTKKTYDLNDRLAKLFNKDLL